MFGMVTVVVCALIMALAETTPWFWLGLVAVPLMAWVLDDTRREHEHCLRAMIDTVAKEQALAKV